MYAASIKSLYIPFYLFDYDVDILICNKSFFTAIDCATKNPQFHEFLLYKLKKINQKKLSKKF